MYKENKLNFDPRTMYIYAIRERKGSSQIPSVQGAIIKPSDINLNTLHSYPILRQILCHIVTIVQTRSPQDLQPHYDRKKSSCPEHGSFGWFQNGGQQERKNGQTRGESHDTPTDGAICGALADWFRFQSVIETRGRVVGQEKTNKVKY